MLGRAGGPQFYMYGEGVIINHQEPCGTTILFKPVEPAASDRVTVCAQARGQPQCRDCLGYDL